MPHLPARSTFSLTDILVASDRDGLCRTLFSSCMYWVLTSAALGGLLRHVVVVSHGELGDAYVPVQTQPAVTHRHIT